MNNEHVYCILCILHVEILIITISKPGYFPFLQKHIITLFRCQ
jgi:hypothetical protein